MTGRASFRASTTKEKAGVTQSPVGILAQTFGRGKVYWPAALQKSGEFGAIGRKAAIYGVLPRKGYFGGFYAIRHLPRFVFVLQ